MKIKLLLLAILLTVVLPSCKEKVETSIEATMSIEVLKEQEMLVRQLLYEGYAPLINNQYELRISEAEAAKRGIMPETYRLMQKMAEDANELIRQMIDRVQTDPDIKDKTIDIIDYNVISETADGDQINTELQTRAMPSGVIKTTMGSVKGYGDCDAPMDMKFVDCHCYAALFAVHTVTTRTQGATKDGTRWLSGNLKVALHASNTYCTIIYSTTDSNGGTCSWKGVAR